MTFLISSTKIQKKFYLSILFFHLRKLFDKYYLTMVLSEDPPFLFVHVPKTAGSSIEESLFNYQSFDFSRVTHGVSLQYKNHLNDDFYFSLFSFGFVRNPWDLQVSCWRYYLRNWGVDMTFEEYIEWKFFGSIVDMYDRVPNTYDGNVEMLVSNAFYIHRTPQTLYFIDESGKFLVNYIGAFETLQKNFTEICELAKISDDFLPHTNSSLSENDDRDYRKYYNENTKKIVASRFNMDLIVFEYDFDRIYPNFDKIGLIKEGSSIKDYGYEIPVDFYFSPYDITYGMGGIKNIYENESEEVLQARSEEFMNEKYQRRMRSLEFNIGTINERIQKLEDHIVDGNFKTSEMENLKREIYKLQDRRLVYKIELKKMKDIGSSLGVL